MPAGHNLRKNRTVRNIRQSPAGTQEQFDLFLLTSKTLSTSSRGDPYLRMTLEDRTGGIDAFVWDNADQADLEAEPGDVVEVGYRAKIHKGTPQLHVTWFRRIGEKELAGLDLSELRPGLDRGTLDRNWASIGVLIDEIRDPHLRSLLQGFVKDASFRDRFQNSRAAKTFHHAYDGGLAEHTLTLMRLAKKLGDEYGERLNTDLLIAGAFLHDIAKTTEFDPRTGEYTDEGRLLGHIVLGVQMLDAKTRDIDGFPPALRLQLAHLILSHHERSEWGSPIRPQTAEAIALHYLDNLDAKLMGAWAWMEKEGTRPGEWTSYWRGMETALLRTPEGTPRSESADRQELSMRELEAELLHAETGAPPSSPSGHPAGTEPGGAGIESTKPSPAKTAKQEVLF